MNVNKIALVGNPNTGKTSLFNALTGLNQQVGNFPGVTVDKKVGKLKLSNRTIELVDLPGTYSIYPRSKDEEVVYDILSNPQHPDFPDAVCVVVDSSNLERNLLLFTQIYSLAIPIVLVLNMSDIAFRKGKKILVEKINEQFPEATIIETNARIKSGVKQLIDTLDTKITARSSQAKALIAKEDVLAQQVDTEQKYQEINELVKTCVLQDNMLKPRRKVTRLDKLFVHPIWGYSIFLVVLLALFQLIFTLASFPMDLIDSLFGSLSSYLHDAMPAGMFTDLLANGIVPGIGGVIIFVPQIVLLFFFIGILEETGYMSRVVFIMDRIMRPFGLNGKSVVPLLSSAACAIPGVMASRTISNWKERLITILVAPLMSCSARIPVYTLLISLVIPNRLVFGFLNLQGLTFFGLYALGIISALLVSVVLRMFIKTNEESVLL